MKQFITILIAVVLFTSCSTDKEYAGDVFTKVYSPDNLLQQTFSINASRDTVLKGKSGTTVKIYKNTFINSKGQLVSGNVDIKLNEAFTTLDMVLANLTTTSDGRALQTAGMIFIDATSQGEPLQIAGDREIGIVIPTDSARTGMQVFEGLGDSSGINWKNPVPLDNDAVVPLNRIAKDTAWVGEKGRKVRTNVAYIVKGYEDGKNIPADVTSKVSDLAWGGKGLMISKDSVIKIGIYTVQLVKDSIREFDQFDASFTTTPVKGTNMFIEDPKTNYIFSVKKLGWANIDRLLNDPRTKEVEFVTTIENKSDFKIIYITMVTEKMFLPGYQMLNETFCFTHNDQEKPQLPVGASATIMATAYKNDKPYFSIQKCVIANKQTISLKLEETTLGKLKKELEKQL